MSARFLSVIPVIFVFLGHCASQETTPVHSVNVKGHITQRASIVEVHFAPPSKNADEARRAYVEIPKAEISTKAAAREGYGAISLAPGTSVTIHAAGESAEITASDLVDRSSQSLAIRKALAVFAESGSIRVLYTARAACLNECEESFLEDANNEWTGIVQAADACRQGGGPNPHEMCLDRLEAAGIGMACSELVACVRECPDPVVKFLYPSDDELVIDATDLLRILNDSGAACNSVRRGIEDVLGEQ